MGSDSSTGRRKRDTYRWLTLRPLYCLVFILPLLLLFQAGTAWYGPTNLLAPRDLHRLLGFFGATASYLPAVMIVAVLLIQHMAHRDPWQIQPRVLAGMAGESLLWVAPLVAMGLLTGRALAQQATTAAAGAATDLWPQLLVAVGAGIYEEFLFRLILLGLVLLIFVDVFGLDKELVAIAGVLLGAVLFSLYHLAPEQIGLSNMPWGAFIFRTMAGIYLGLLYFFRGYAIAVATHAGFNIYVTLVNA